MRTQLEWPFAVDARHASSRYALVDIHPETGRRHQIRRHFKHIGHPLIGDSTHGKGAHNRAVAAWLGLTRLWLHAASITLAHPNNGAPLIVQSSLGSEWMALEPGAPSCDAMLRAACYGASPLPTPLPL
jgi:tRNA pseudouridine65 synthase